MVQATNKAMIATTRLATPKMKVMSCQLTGLYR